jgi:hypothetical protein
MGADRELRTWRSAIAVQAAPELVLETLTDVCACRSWSPVGFTVDGLDGPRLRRGATPRVSGNLGGRRVHFQLEVLQADAEHLRLCAVGPVEMLVDYAVHAASPGSSVEAAVSVRAVPGWIGTVSERLTRVLLTGGARSITRSPEWRARRNADTRSTVRAEPHVLPRRSAGRPGPRRRADVRIRSSSSEGGPRPAPVAGRPACRSAHGRRPPRRRPYPCRAAGAGLQRERFGRGRSPVGARPWALGSAGPGPGAPIGRPRGPGWCSRGRRPQKARGHAPGRRGVPLIDSTNVRLSLPGRPVTSYRASSGLPRRPPCPSRGSCCLRRSLPAPARPRHGPTDGPDRERHARPRSFGADPAASADGRVARSRGGGSADRPPTACARPRRTRRSPHRPWP